MIENRGRYGRIERPLGHPNPFADLLPPAKARDGRSIEVPNAGQPISFRVPKIVYEALKLVARTRHVTVTEVLAELIAPVVRPVIQGSRQLCDPVPVRPVFVGQNHRLPRLEDKRPSALPGGGPWYDRVAEQARRVAKKPPPGLIDRPKAKLFR